MKFLDCITLNPTVNLEKGKIYPFIEMADVSTEDRLPNQIKKKIYTSGCKFEKNDTVIARIEPCIQNGKKFFCQNINKGFGSTEYLVFRPKNDTIEARYLYYLMQTNYVRQSMINSMIGATGRQRVNNDIFNTLEISLPSKKIQDKIANILSSYDDLIENNR